MSIIIKYGGNALHDKTSALAFAQAVKALDMPQIAVVHGGGPQIDHWLLRTQTPIRFIDGQRQTDLATLAIVEMALCGEVNKQLVRAFLSAGSAAVGISGQDGGLLTAEKLQNGALGEVGEISRVNPSLIKHLWQGGYLPIIAPLALDCAYERLNINADYSAAAIAASVKASHLLLLTNVSGLLDAKGALITQISAAEIMSLIQEEVITGGMLPKVRCAISAIEQGVEKVSILDGRTPLEMKKLLAGERVGTTIWS